MKGIDISYLVTTLWLAIVHCHRFRKEKTNLE
jgi:hypothetical protein